MTVIDHFTRTYNDRSYSHVTMVRHTGKLIAFAMSSRRIYYAVLDLDGAIDDELSAATELDHNHWPGTPRELLCPGELAQLGFESAGAYEVPPSKVDGTPAPNFDAADLFMSSTARLSADVPFQVVSDNEYVYVFRQAVAGDHPDNLSPDDVALVDATLLCDRYLLLGDTLVTPRQIRYRRSRNPDTPESNKDTLGATDMNEQPFYEPTLELGFIRGLAEGRFTVLLLPTATPDISRWQFFVDNASTGRIDSINLERSAGGLFNPLGSRFYTSPDPNYQDAVFESRPGMCPFTDAPLVPINRPSVYAESALHFASAGWLEVAQGPVLQGAFTIEAWIRVTNKNDGHGQVIVSQTLAANSTFTAYILSVKSNGTISFGGTKRGWAHGNSVVDDGTWHHVAGTYDPADNQLRVYVDGNLDLDVPQPGWDGDYAIPQTPLRIGALVPSDIRPINGDIDELRLWSRAREANELLHTMGIRLHGDELGLAAYWRFDEAFGTTVYDQSLHAHHLSFAGSGTPTWMASDAPIGDQSGIRRTSFGFANRETIAGLSATLYHQQAFATVGDTSPVKHSARVMLAVPVREPNTTGGSLATVDFAVSREGRLAQFPDELDLGEPLASNADALVAQIQHLEATVASIEVDIAAVQAGEHQLAPDALPDAATFGSSVATAGDWMIAGAPHETSGGTKTGAAYIYKLAGHQWTEHARLTASAEEGLRFGTTVAISDDWAVVGAPHSSGDQPGRVYIYARQGDSWSQSQVIDSPAGTNGDRFGETIAIDDDYLLIGAPHHTGGGTNAGRVSVYKCDQQGTWDVIQHLQAGSNKQFGSAIAMDGREGIDWALIAPFNGYIYVYRRNQQTGDYDAAGMIPDRATQLSLRGLYAALAFGTSVYIYRYDATQNRWLKRTAIRTPYLGGVYGNFRARIRSVVLGENKRLMMSYRMSLRTKVKILKRSNQGATWSTITTASGDFSAYALALRSDWGLVGAPMDGAGGSVHLLDFGVLDKQLADTMAELAGTYKSLEQEAVPLRLAHIDPMGLTTCAGLLDFAPCETTALLCSTSDGRLGLYFRGRDNGLFYACYFDGAVIHGTQSVGPVLLRSRAPLPERDEVAVTVSAGGQPGTCTVIIDDPSAGLRERWQEVPRAADRFAAALTGGLREAAWVGAVDGVLDGEYSSLPLAGGLRRTFTAGSSLQVGGTTVETSADVAAGATAIPIETATLTAASGASVHWLPYDYATKARVYDTPYTLLGTLKDPHSGAMSNLSLEAASMAAVASGDCLVVDGLRLRASSAHNAGIMSLSIDAVTAAHSLRAGARVYAAAPEDDAGVQSLAHDLRYGSLHANARTDDNTWVGDGPAARTQRSIPCRWIANSPGNALTFDGVDDFVRTLDAEEVSRFASEDPLTLEAWVKPGDMQTRGQILHHRDNGQGYTLGIRPRDYVGFTFTGETNYIALRNYLNNPVAKLTVQAWVRIDDATEQSIIISFDRSEYWHLAVGNDVDLPQGRVFWATTGQGGTTHDMVGARVIAGDGLWHFISVSFDNSTGEKRIYIDGELDAIDTQNHGSSALGTPSVTRYGFIGAGSEAAEFNQGTEPAGCEGSIAEVRHWGVARSAAQVRADMHDRPDGSEPELQHYWRFDGLSGADATEVPNLGSPSYPGTIVGTLTSAPRQLAAFAKVVRAEGERFVEASPHFLHGTWRHLAAVYRPAYGLGFADSGQPHLKTRTSDQLDLTASMTIEGWLSLSAAGGGSRGLVSKGRYKREKSIPYALWINAADQIEYVFSSYDSDGDVTRYHRARFTDKTLERDKMYRIALVRHELNEVDSSSSTSQFSFVDGDGDEQQINITTDSVKGMRKVYAIDCYVTADTRRPFDEGDRAGATVIIRDAAPGSSKAQLYVGRLHQATDRREFAGTLSELRIWNRALDRAELGDPYAGSRAGLVGWWPMQDNKGLVTRDAIGDADLYLHGDVSWVEDPVHAELSLFIDGERVTTRTPAFTQDDGAASQTTMGARSIANNVTEVLQGRIEELRVWKTARSDEQILDNLFRRLRGETGSLIAYYPFDVSSQDTVLTDHGPRGLNLAFGGVESKPAVDISDAPISTDAALVRPALAQVTTGFHEQLDGAPGVAEYGDLQRSPEGAMSGVMKRAYAYAHAGEWRLVTGYKVGNLITEWISQVQFNPEVIGYVEGAPPVPSENLTAGPIDPAYFDYVGKSSVTVNEAEEVTYSFSSARQSSYDASFAAALNRESNKEIRFVTAPLGIGITTNVAGAKFKIAGEMKYELETSSSWEQARSHSYGRNYSQSLNVSLGGYWEDPVNRLNTAMTRRFVPDNSGFVVVESETADVFALRLAHNRALVSLSIRPNPDIPPDRNLIPFKINPRYTKQGTLDGRVGFDDQGAVLDPDYAGTSGYGEYSYFKPREAYAREQEIRRAEEELRERFRSHETHLAGMQALGGVSGAMAGMAGLGMLASPLGALGYSTGALINTIGHMAAGLSSGTGLPDRFAKRDLVNSYVWTADGGFYAESTELTTTRQETKTGSFSVGSKASSEFSAMIEAGGEKFGYALNGSMGGGLSRTKAKSEESKTSFSLEVDIDIPGDLQKYDDSLTRVYDVNGNVELVPGKVDAYRFMTFYLHGDSSNGADLFNKVVDPIWFEQSNHPNAAALRQAKATASEPDCWRVYHRVTFISRLLPPLANPNDEPQTVDEAMSKAQIESNWLLIDRLRPFVHSHTHSYPKFRDAAFAAIDTYLPELAPHKDEIVILLCNYFGVPS